MRRGMLAAGVGAGIMAIGVPAASAADVTITFNGGTTTVGSQSPFAVGTPAAPATLMGTIADDFLSSTFPKADITLPTQTLAQDVTAGTATGKLSLVSTPAGDFKGTTVPAGSGISVNLSGTVNYTLRFVPNGGGAVTECPLTPSSPLSLTGGQIDLKTGVYAASGQTALPAAPLAPSLTCLSLLGSGSGFTKVAATGKLAIPGLIPLPSPTTPTPTVPSATSTTPSTTTPAELGPAQLALVATKPKTVKRGKSTTFKFAVANGGGVAAKSLKVTFKTPKGVKVAKKTIKRSTLAAGTFKTYTVRLRTTKKAKKSGKVTLTAKAAGGLKATAKTTLKLR